jgi:hypothetical protein
MSCAILQKGLLRRHPSSFDHGFTPLHYCLIIASFDFGVEQ